VNSSFAFTSAFVSRNFREYGSSVYFRVQIQLRKSKNPFALPYIPTLSTLSTFVQCVSLQVNTLNFMTQLAANIGMSVQKRSQSYNINFVLKN